MVSLPALLAEAPHIPYKLQLSLESCDFDPPLHPPTPWNPSRLEIRWGASDADRSEWAGNVSPATGRPASRGVYLGGWQGCCGRWPLASTAMSVGGQHESCKPSCRRFMHVNHVWIGAETGQVDMIFFVLRDHCSAVGLVAAAWGSGLRPSREQRVMHTDQASLNNSVLVRFVGGSGEPLEGGGDKGGR